MTSHTCDGNYRTWMEIVPAARYERDTTVAIYNGRMHTEYPADRTNMELKGTIPEARSTYQFLNTSYPCLNEKQLGIGETTISGRKELQNKKGMFMIEELEKIALQRCTTAREAIRLIGQLVAEYGYGDSGECLTIADPEMRSGISRCSARGRTRSGVYGRLSASRTIMWGYRPISRVSRRST